MLSNAEAVDTIVKSRYAHEDHFVSVVTNIISELELDKKRMDLLESKVFTNREGEHEIHLDFTVGSLREACDMILRPSVIIKAHDGRRI